MKVDAEGQFTRYADSYNEAARRNGLPIYADPAPMMKLSSLLDADSPRYMTLEQCAAFRAEYFRRMYELSLPLAEQGFNFRKRQSNRAKKERGVVSDDGETLTSIIRGLALSNEYRELSARELWPHLFATLRECGLDPDEQDCADNWKKSRYEYMFKEGTKSITGGQFANRVSDFRKGEKSG